jgi:antitoxin component of MazEF toxin-antitoxin module
MPVIFKRAVFKSGNSYRITLPMPIVKTLGIEEKDELEIWMGNSNIIIQKPVRKADTTK